MPVRPEHLAASLGPHELRRQLHSIRAPHDRPGHQALDTQLSTDVAQRDFSVPLNMSDDGFAMTFCRPIRARSVISASCMPAAKCSCSGSCERFSSGNTAIEWIVDAAVPSFARAHHRRGECHRGERCQHRHQAPTAIQVAKVVRRAGAPASAHSDVHRLGAECSSLARW